MIKRVVEISSRPARLRVERGQLVLVQEDTDPVRIPCEDVGILIIDQCRTSYTHSVLTTLLEHNAAVVLCGPDHLPAGMLLPVTGNQESARRQRVQVGASLPLRKRLWQQIVRQKIARQACALPEGCATRRKLLALVPDVKSGDRTNVEAHAARLYWPALLGAQFRRRHHSAWPNPALDYGYAVLRAALARALVAAGLNPAFSLFHENRRNAFALADDLLEPFRPVVDVRVRAIRSEQNQLTPEIKRHLLSILHMTVRNDGRSGPLMVELHRLCGDLWRCYDGQARRLRFPEWEDEWN